MFQRNVPLPSSRSNSGHAVHSSKTSINFQQTTQCHISQLGILHSYRGLCSLAEYQPMLHGNTMSLPTEHHGISVITQYATILIPMIDYFYGCNSSITLAGNHWVKAFSYSRQLQEGFVMNDVQSMLIHEGRADLAKELKLIQSSSIKNDAHVANLQNFLQVIRDGNFQIHKSILLCQPQDIQDNFLLQWQRKTKLESEAYIFAASNMTSEQINI